LPTSSEKRMTALAVRTEGLGKQYLISARRRNKGETLRDALSARARRMSSALFGSQDAAARGARAQESFWALRDVSIEIREGEVVGLIGPNGAGKSTLLKILSRITAPTEGRGEIHGRVGSLLEVGTGFHQELTGRENILLNGAILGMRKTEVELKFDEIVAFAEVDQFIDTPVKRYSTGMFLRLAFAVAAHLEPDVLIVDEVLAVGDAAFQKKCLGKMGAVAGEGRTVVFVSHNMDAVQRLCTRAILLRQGTIAGEGPVRETVLRYLSSALTRGGATEWIDLGSVVRSGSGETRFTAARYWSSNAELGYLPYPYGQLEIELLLSATRALTIPSFMVALRTQSGTSLIKADIMSQGKTVQVNPGMNSIRFRIDQLLLLPGVYAVTLWAGTATRHPYDYIETAFELEVIAADVAGFGVTPWDPGVVPCEFEFSAATPLNSELGPEPGR
jgi:lipopolysaccharide transport system ATP-binding protein